MALVVADRVKQTAASISGTGTYTLSGTFTGFQTFTDGVGDGNTTYYAAVQDANFEIGIGTYTASGTTLARTTILQSSNSDNAVNWSSATPTIFTTYPADKAVFKDASNNINGTFVGNITGNVTGNTSGTAATVTGAAQTNITSVGTLSSLTTSGDITVGDDLTVEGGQIDLRSNSGAVGKMKFYCEVSNAHAQTLQAQPHSASSSAVLTLPVNTGTLVGTGDSGSVSNTMLGGSIANSKLANSSINFGGVSLALGASDTTPAFDLSDATNYPTSSLSGTITNAQLAGSIANAKLSNSSITVSDGSNTSAVALGGTLTFAGTSNEVEVAESSGTVTIGLPSSITANVTGNLTGNASGTAATVTGAAQTNITSLGTLTGLTVDGDVTLTGANYNVTWDKSDDALEFADGAELRFGAGNDLKIRHDTSGNNSRIIESGTGSLVIQAENLNMASANAGEDYIKCIKDGAVELYHNDSKKLETSSNGVTVTGEVDATSLDISGDADIDGTLEADAITVNGTALNTVIADEATALAIALG